MTDRAEWLEWRTRGIGASDIAGILGNSPWASPYSVWTSKRGFGADGTSGNVEAMRWGGLLEDAILDETARRLDIRIISRQERVEYPEWPIARATLDGRYYSDTDPEDHGVIEVKTTSTPVWHEVPEYYEAQVQWQLFITGEPRAWLPCLHMGRRLSLWQIDADPEIGRAMIEVARSFWDRYVSAGIAPNVDGTAATSAAIAARYTAPAPDVVVDVDHLAADVDQLRLIRDAIKDLSATKDDIENRLKDALGDEGEAGAIDGQIAFTWRRSRDYPKIDEDLLREKYPREAAECTSMVRGSRRFLLKGVK
jgi:putative phage-type endonuclease